MKVLFFVSSMQGGGAERVAALLSNEWVAAGHEVWLIPTYSERGACAYPLDERVHLEFLADRIASYNRYPHTQFKRLLQLRRLVREVQPDAVVSFLPRVNVAVILATRGMKVPVIVAERTYPPRVNRGVFLRAMIRLLYRRANAVVMQTSQGLAWLDDFCSPAPGVCIPNPVTIPIPPRPGRIEPGEMVSADEKVLLAVGRLHPAKGFDLLISAFADLSPEFPDWRLVIIGEGEQRAELEIQRSRLNADDRVLLPGLTGNVSDWYQRADLFVLSSRYEGFPNALLEAMAHGKAVISFDCDTGPSEIIRSGENGVLVPVAQGVRALTEALAALMRDGQLRMRLGAEAEQVGKTHEAPEIAQQWISLFENCGSSGSTSHQIRVR